MTTPALTSDRITAQHNDKHHYPVDGCAVCQREHPSAYHETYLRAVQAEVDVERPIWESRLEARRQAVTAARADDMSIYRIAQVLGVEQNAVRQILKL